MLHDYDSCKDIEAWADNDEDVCSHELYDTADVPFYV